MDSDTRSPKHTPRLSSNGRVTVIAKGPLMTATNKLTVDQDDLNWLIAQLEAWPERAHPGRTTNVEFLMKTAAHALRHRQQAEARAERLVAALSKAAERFREYEYSHAAKGSIDGDAKARRNCEMAEMCEIALTAYRSASTMRDTK